MLAKVIEKVTHKPYVENYYNRLANPYKLKHSAFFDEKVYQKYMARGYKIIHNKFSLMHPKILDQYYGAGNLYMAPHDMGQLILALQHYKIFDADDESTTSMNLIQNNILRNTDTVFMLCRQ